MMRRLLVLWMALVVGLALLSMCGSAGRWYQGGYAGGYRGQARGYASGGVAKVDTFRIWTHESTFPNMTAVAAGYVDTTILTTENEASNSSAVTQFIRYGEVRKANPDSVFYSAAGAGYALGTQGRGNTTEDNFTWGASQRLVFVWVSANGIRNGDRIEDAYLMVGSSAFDQTIPSGQYLVCRLDTISTDYRILNGDAVGRGTCNDYAMFDATWNQPNKGVAGAWSPTLDARDDWHDFGPRSSTVIPAGSYTKGTCWRLDVTDAVQQASDNGTLGRGLLFVLYLGNSTSDIGFTMGNNPTFCGSAWGKGNPSFTATATSRRGAKPWGGVRVPITLQFDDSYLAQVGYYRALTDSGMIFSAAACSTNIKDDAAHSDMLDSLYAIAPNSLYFIHHTASHASIGSLSGTGLDKELRRTWFKTLIDADFDTTQVVDYALAGGVGSPVFNVTAAERLVDFGYRSMRSGGFYWSTGLGEGFRHDTRLSWDGYVNKYQIWSVPCEYIFGIGGGAPGATAATNAQIKEQLEDYVDNWYTNYGKSALVMYAHYYDPGDDQYASWVSEDNLRYFIGLTNRLNSCQILPHRTVLGMRFAGETFMTPSQVETAVGVTADSNMIQLMGAQQDSIYQLGGHENLLRMWINPHPSSQTAKLEDVIAPGAPSSMIASSGDGYAYLTWTASPTTEPVTYRLYRKLEGESSYTLVQQNIGYASAFDQTVINGSPYLYHVTAVDAAGNESDPTSDVTAWPGTIKSIPRPAYYALWFQDRHQAALTTAALDSMATLDAVITGPFPAEGPAQEPAYASLVAGLRARNGDEIVLMYAHPWMIRTDVGSANMEPYKRILAWANTAADSSGFARGNPADCSSGVIYGSEYPGTLILNVARTAAADTMAFIWAEAYQKLATGISDSAWTGLFVDDVVFDPLYGAYSSGCAGIAAISSIADFNQDDTPMYLDAEDQATWNQYQLDFIKCLRREFAQRGLSNRLIVGNTTIGRADTVGPVATAIFERLDGAMIEGVNRWWPGNAAADTTWDKAFAIRDLMTHSQVAPPMQMFQVHSDSNAAYQAEVLALANDSWVGAPRGIYDDSGNNTIPPMLSRRLPNPGTWTGYDIASGGADPDTLTADWSAYNARILLQRNASAPDSTFAVWPYIVYSGADTLSLSRYWERAADIGAPDAPQFSVNYDGATSIEFDRRNLLEFGGSAAGDFASYNVYRSLDGGSNYTLFKTDPVQPYPGPASVTWYDSTATNDSTYWYYATSVDYSGNESADSDPGQGIPHDASAPSVPASVIASGGPYYVDVDWVNSTAADLQGYYIARAPDVAGAPGTYTARYDSTTISAYQDSTALAGERLWYKVRSYDDDGNISAYSNAVVGSWSSPVVGAPTSLVAQTNTPNQQYTRLSWTAPSNLTNFDSYNVYRDRSAPYDSLYDEGIATATFDDAHATYDSTFYYSVTAVYSPGGESAHSNVVSVKNLDLIPPLTPTLQIAAGNGSNGIDLNWSDSPSAAKYYVFRIAGHAIPSAKIDSTTAPVSLYTDTGATQGATYTYAIKARDSSWNFSALSDTLSASWTSTPSGNPSISSVSGTISHGSAVTLIGTGFGTKAAAAPRTWDTLEDGSCNTSATIGTWESTRSLLISNESRHANSSKSATINFQGSLQGTTGYGGCFTGLNSYLAPKWFVQYWFKLDNNFNFGTDFSTDRNLTNVKMYRMGYPWSSGQENFYLGIDGTTYGGQGEYDMSDNGLINQVTRIPNKYPAQLTKGVWHLLQVESKESDQNVYNGVIRIWMDGELWFERTDWMTRINDSVDKRPFIVGFENELWDGNTDRDDFYIDDAYIDDTWARVELGNASTYAACTVREIQPPTSWAATSIGVTLNTGSLANGTAYLYVVNSDGTVSAGKAVTISN